MKRTVWKNAIQTAAAIGVMVVVWLVIYACVGNDLLVPSLSDTLFAFFETLGAGWFWLAFLDTLLRVLLAFAFSFLLAIVYAVTAYLLPAFSRFFAPFVAFLRSLPVLAVLLVVLMWSNAGVAPVVVAFLSLFPMLYTGFYAGLAGVDNELAEMSRVFQVPLKKRVFDLYLPTLTPYLFRESGGAIGFGVKLVVSAEVLARTAGSLGNAMQEAQLFSQTPLLFALVLVACFTGFVFQMLGECLARWFERSGK